MRKFTPPEIVWHYTVGTRIVHILSEGVIKTATAGVPPGQQPAVWFSANPKWEETANKGLLDLDTGTQYSLTKEQTEEWNGGLFRIEVKREDAPYSWAAFKSLSGCSRDLARGLYNSAIRMGSRPSDWWVSFEPFTKDKWRALESWNGEKWVPFTGDGTARKISELSESSDLVSVGKLIQASATERSMVQV